MAQQDSIVYQDTMKAAIERSMLRSQQTFSPDTIPGSGQKVKISKDAVTDKVDYYSRDTSWFEAKNNKIHLYGDARVTYGKRELKAGYIIFDLEKDEATAYKTKDPESKRVEEVTFSDGPQNIRAEELRFNFSTKKGIIRNAITKEGEFNVLGEKAKFVSAEGNPLLNQDQLFNKNAVITTCTNDHPHFGIRTRKLKVIPDELAVAGLSNLEIMGIPTPAILPFGFFPLIKGRSSGLIFPTLWTYEEEFGLGFQGIGYYFPINDYMDARITGDIFTRGTYRINASTTYKKRYAYSGSAQLEYANLKSDNNTSGITTTRQSFKFTLNHKQDSKAHPYRSIGGSINFQTNRHDQLNRQDVQAQLTNQIGSNFNFRHSLPGTPFNLAVGLQHRQNTQTRNITVNFPKATLNMKSIYPFKKKGSSGDRWYENINVRYNAAADSRIEGSDTTFFSRETWDNLQSGVSHDASIQTSARVLNYFNFTPQVNYDEVWYFRTLDRNYDPTLLLDTVSVDTTLEGVPVYEIDTTFGAINDEFVNGFRAYRDFTANMSLSTQIFGTRRFSRGPIRGFRHTIKPTISFAYSPGTRERYEEILQAVDANGEPIEETYNPFTGGLYNSRLDEEQMSLNYNIINIFETKYYSYKDSTEKNFNLIRNLTMSGGYNFAADSLKMSALSIRGNTPIIKNITNLNFGATFDAYVRNSSGRLINRSVWEDRSRPFAFNRFNANLSTNLTLSTIRNWFVKKDDKKKKTKSTTPQATSPRQQTRPTIGQGSLWDLIEGFRITHNYNVIYERQPTTQRDTFRVQTHTIRLQGNLQLTENWRVNVGNVTYDIKNKSFVYPYLSFERDLHCWQMNFTWAPERGSYTFFIGVKSNALSFVKYNYGENNFGGGI